VKPAVDRRRRSGRREHALPDVDVHVRSAGFGEGRHAGQGGDAARAGDADAFELA
jgi:hypothetical protein